MRRQINADQALLEKMNQSFQVEGKFEKIVVGRFAIAAKDDLPPWVNTSSASVFSDQNIVGSLNGRIDKLAFSDIDVIPDKLCTDICKSVIMNPQHLRGDFAVAVYDTTRERLIIARDPLGTRPVYYYKSPDYLAFSTEIRPLLTLIDSNDKVDEVWIADSISTIKSEKWRTPYSRIRKVLPGHRLIVEQNVKQAYFWDLKMKDSWDGISYLEAVEVFREKLALAVRHRSSGSKNIAAELSGGLDSSGITVMGANLAHESQNKMIALTHGFSEKSLGKYYPYSDERKYSQELINLLNIPQVFCDADGFGIIDMLRQNIFRHSGPTQQEYSMFSDVLYERAKESRVSKLLSGFGGDEGVTSKAGGFFEEMAKLEKWDIYKNEYLLKGRLAGNSYIKSYTTFILKRYFPIAHSFLKKLLDKPDWQSAKYERLGFDGEFASRLGIEARYYERAGFPDDPDVRARQYKKIMHDHVSQRFEYSYQDAKFYGIEYAYPLCDIDLLEFYFSLPSEYKFRNGMGRALYRDAMTGILPEKIRLRIDKTGATIPTIFQRIMTDNNNIKQLILRSRLNNKYHYLDYDKMLDWNDRLSNMGSKRKIPSNPAAFFNSLQILLLQEMERNGEFKSGIRT